jgi:hypothetical protein
VFCLLIFYVEVFSHRNRQHFRAVQNKLPNNSLNILIFSVLESRWKEQSFVNKQHFMNVEFLCVHRDPQLCLVLGADIYMLECHMVFLYLCL